LAEYPAILAGARNNGVHRTQLKGFVARVLVDENLAVTGLSRQSLTDAILHEILGYGPIEPLIEDPEVTEIMVNGPETVYVEREGCLELTPVKFRGIRHLEDIIGRIVGPLGRRIDQSQPFVDARLPNGSRVNAIVPPLSLSGPNLTIRKFARKHLLIRDLCEKGSLSTDAVQFLETCVMAKCNLLVSGGTGSGKTTTINALARCIDPRERIITIEDAQELQLSGHHWVSLESRPPNLEGKGEITIRQLLRNALRMRPDRIIIGEVRGAEAFDLLQAMNTGHDGSISTIHANSASDALVRLESMVLMASEGLPHGVIRDQVRRAIDVVIHQVRLRDGRRRITEIVWMNRDSTAGSLEVIPVFPATPGDGSHVPRTLAGAPFWFIRKVEQLGAPLNSQAQLNGQDRLTGEAQLIGEAKWR
jgi:pilus assembly protein CpaF